MYNSGVRAGVDFTTHILADMFEASDPKFNKAKFLSDVGVKNA